MHCLVGSDLTSSISSELEMNYVMDGAVLEGVGQVIRNCSAYAAILGTFVYLKNIRVRRHRPGLRLQYVEGLEVVARFSNCALQVGSQFENLATKWVHKRCGSFQDNHYHANRINVSRN